MTAIHWSTGFIETAQIRWLIQQGSAEIEQYNWLFVALDSNRDSKLHACRKPLETMFTKIGARFRWGAEGFWVTQADLGNLAREKSFPVPFSAAYLFPQEVTTSPVFTYNLTSETDNFSESVPPILLVEMEKTGAEGFVADGQGLNYAVSSPRLFETIKKMEMGTF